MSQTKKLRRSNTDRMLFGVCGGLAEHFGIDALITRIIFILLGLINGFGIVLYLVMVLIVPRQTGKLGSIDRVAKVKEFVTGIEATAEKVVTEVRDEAKSVKNAIKRKKAK